MTLINAVGIVADSVTTATIRIIETLKGENGIYVLIAFMVLLIVTKLNELR